MKVYSHLLTESLVAFPKGCHTVRNYVHIFMCICTHIYICIHIYIYVHAYITSRVLTLALRAGSELRSR